jgi:hypothetical protein
MTPLPPLQVHRYNKLKQQIEAGGKGLTPAEEQEFQELHSLMASLDEHERDATIRKVESERLLGFIAVGVGILLLSYPFLGVPMILGGAYLISGFAGRE